MPSIEPSALDPGQDESLRTLSRSPHPYHHQSFELPPSSSRFALRRNVTAHPQLNTQLPSDPKPKPRPARPRGASNDAYPLSPLSGPSSSFSKDSSPASDSGTEADDEHFLKGLPAPKVKPHKGLRGCNEPLSGASTPVLSPVVAEQDGIPPASRRASMTGPVPDIAQISGLLHQQRVLVRRAVEAGILAALGLTVWTNRQVAPSIEAYGSDYRRLAMLFGTLTASYPLRVIAWDYQNQRSLGKDLLRLPSTFDPAPLLYPPTLTILVSLLVSTNNPAVILPNIVLSICSLPRQLLPALDRNPSFDVLHWAFTCLPLAWHDATQLDQSSRLHTSPTVPGETLVLLYPLHVSLCFVLHYLTTTSLLTAELQLLSVALVNVLVLATSPQIRILQALLWGGGLGVLIFCGPVIRWGITLARVPKWRFRKGPAPPVRHLNSTAAWFRSLRKIKHDLLGSTADDGGFDATASSGDESAGASPQKLQRVRTSVNPAQQQSAETTPVSPTKGINALFGSITRRHTLPFLDKSNHTTKTSYTPSGRPKRAISVSARPYLKLTQGQASLRKWLYAIYVYICVILIVLVGIRAHIQHLALNGDEPIGWALGYFFGNMSWFRLQVVKANVSAWICLPTRPDVVTEECSMGWVQHIRRHDFGEANTRLMLSGYWLTIVAFGLLIVFQLKETFEVDTRRKVFHFMMVGMFLPATFVDPTFAALGLAVVLAIFLLLDLLRASQLPPLSKPIASFLAPYVDGRDFRGPVVISHIFLLIGCAIPLWLALGSLPRTGEGHLAGWEVPTREVSMVSGVICVGLGDAAASLIGRRWGHRKWLWGGGKSVEGSVAMAAAVFAGLMTASAWLRIGRWPMTDESTSMLASTRDAAVCASVASLTEAVLTGGNDNVIVPVVLWTCVKSLGV